MVTVLAIIAILLGVLGIVGSIIPALPGPPLSWLGMLAAYIRLQVSGNGDDIGTVQLLIWLVVTVTVTVLDYFVPGWMTKASGGSRYAGWGATAGMFIGMFVPPVGIITGALAGAFIAELAFAGSSVWTSAKSAIGAFAGFILGTGLKLIVSGMMFWETAASIW